MKRSVTLLFVCACSLRAASAPDSISGTVYRESGGIAAIRLAWEHTIIFGPDGRYTFVSAKSASTLNRNWSVETPPVDGMYSYTKTGPSTGTVTFSDGGVNRVYGVTAGSAAPAVLTLDFSGIGIGVSSAAGTRGEFDHSIGGHGTFTLANLSTVQREPLRNVSMRGSVSAERPLIVGFEIRGESRDALIRVVGPTLRAFEVSESWEDPSFEIYPSGSATPLGGGPGPRRDAPAYYDDWSADSDAVPGLLKLFAHTGAFQLESGSRDAVGVPRLAPGAYTVVCTAGGNSAGGNALVEVYVLP